ncbi:MAG TPA: HD domain-containing protein [Candidatus Brocadiia bacterium]|nr:HD domain-containing protein [Candidatus Brocadiia bacterium]
MTARDEIRKVVDSAMRKYDWEPEHALHVRDLALQLFDELEELHELKPPERWLLELSAMLHDVGLSVERSGHHKESFKIIMSEPLPGLDNRQRMIIALVARYHRKGLPKSKHKAFGDLPSKDRARVKKLAAILRIADGLDRSHWQAISSVKFKKDSNELELEIKGVRLSEIDIQGAMRKSDLIEAVFGRKLKIIPILG